LCALSPACPHRRLRHSRLVHTPPAGCALSALSSPSTPFHLILRSERGEKRPDVRSLSDLRLYYCGIEETGRFFRSISLNRTYYSPRSSEQSASVPRSLATNAQAGQAPRRASAGIASSLSSSRNKADGCFSPCPEGAPQTRQCCVTALGKRVNRFPGGQRSTPKRKDGLSWILAGNTEPFFVALWLCVRKIPGVFYTFAARIMPPAVA